MLLLTYSLKQPYDFCNIQHFLSEYFAGNCCLNHYSFGKFGKSCTEISFLFLLNEVRVFYSIPREDLYDSFYLNDSCNITELVINFYSMFGCDAEVSAHISYTDVTCPVQSIV